MTNKTIFSIATFILFLSINLTSAQKVGVRVEYGMNSIAKESKYLISAGKEVDYNISTQDVSGSQSIGLFTSFDFGYLFFQPEIMYTTFSTNISIEGFGEGKRTEGVTTITEKFSRVDLPVYAGVKIKNFKIGAGPVFHIAEGIDTEIANFDKIEIEPAQFTAGLQLGLGYSFRFVDLDIKYQRDFNQSTDHIRFNGGHTGLRSSLSSIKVGLAFSLAK